MSDRQRIRLQDYLAAKKAYMLKQPLCEICGAPAEEIHHRNHRGSKIADEQYFLAVCAHHHWLIHWGATTTMPANERTYKEWRKVCGTDEVFYGPKWARHFNYLI